MKAKLITLSMIFMVGALLFSCATYKPATEFVPLDLNSEVASGRWVKNVDNFLVLMDTSSSMEIFYNDYSKFDAARIFLERLNQSIPDLAITSSYITVGHNLAAAVRTVEALKKSALIYGPADYNREEYQIALGRIKEAGGYSHMDLGVDAATQMLQDTAGKIAVIVVSDGEGTDTSAAVLAARRMKATYGERICIYTVLVGNHPAGETLLKQMTAEGECGFFITSEQVATGDDMAVFVKRVFLTEVDLDSDGDGVPNDLDECPNTPPGVQVDAKGCPLDSDGDGVPDYLDQCPGTPPGVEVDANGCPLDSDGDGVPDYMDQCPGTPMGASVNSVGCWGISDVAFDYKKYSIKPSFYHILDGAADILKKNPSLRIEIQGHTDNIGSRGYNQVLSERRAGAVKNYLMKKDIAGDRMTTRGYYFSRPQASNKTDAGRARNRRVVFKVLK